MTSKELAWKVAKFADDKKAHNICILCMEELTIVTDYFVIVSASSSTQVKAICDNVEDRLAEENIKLLHKEGIDNSQWVLLDYGDIVVHIFLDEVREFYDLEALWSDAQVEHYIGEE